MLTLDRNAELALFKRLSSEPKLLEWLQGKLDGEKETLVKANDLDVIRKAQGKAQLLTAMVDLLNAGKSAP